MELHQEMSGEPSDTVRSSRSSRRRKAADFYTQLMDQQLQQQHFMLAMEAKVMDHFGFIESQVAFIMQSLMLQSMATPAAQSPVAESLEIKVPQVQYTTEIIEVPRYKFIFKDVELDGTSWTAPAGVKPSLCACDNVQANAMNSSANIYNIMEELGQEADVARQSPSTPSSKSPEHFFIGECVLNDESSWEPLPPDRWAEHFAGNWEDDEGNIVNIMGSAMHGRNGEQLDLTFTSESACQFSLDGISYRAILSPSGELQWDDGCKWTRAVAGTYCAQPVDVRGAGVNMSKSQQKKLRKKLKSAAA